MAQDQELDLVEISADAKPPVVKIIDWGKYNYQRTKQQQKNKRTSKTLEVKQMRLGLKIGEHDLQTKMSKVSKFLTVGHKVKITVFFRGRELAHKDIGFTLANKIIDSFGERIAVDQQPQLNGKQLGFVIRANPLYKAPQADKSAEAATEEAKSEAKSEELQEA